MRSSCCGLWRTGRLRGRLRFDEPAYRAGQTALLLLDAHNKSSKDITEVMVRMQHMPHRDHGKALCRPVCPDSAVPIRRTPLSAHARSDR